MNFRCAWLAMLVVAFVGGSATATEPLQTRTVERGTFTDSRDGQTYRTVTVNGHTWMAENLNFKTGGSWPYGDDPANGSIFGRLYTFRSALKAAPPGWHVATDAEWKALVNAVGGNEVAGRFLKSAKGWPPRHGVSDGGQQVVEDGIDAIGFNALPGGDRFIDNTYRNLGQQGSWWSVGEGVKPVANRILMDAENDAVYHHERGEGYKRSVRCVKDYSTDQAPKFAATVKSLKQYQCPEWFRDAKFGIYLHWGVYSVPARGEWYPRYMYWEGTDEYKHHLKEYGHPSEFGYKDFIPMWKAENFDPDALVALFKKSGARYFTPCAVHHDNFDLWNSRHHPWNAVNMGPKKDLIGMWKEATQKAGLRWGVTTHLARSHTWCNTANGADTVGPMKNVPYDAAQGKGQGLYPVDIGQSPVLTTFESAPPVWREHWFKRLKQLIDDYQPDHLYFDGAIPFYGDDNAQTGIKLMAHYYNTRPEGVLSIKRRKSGLYAEGVAMLDHERGNADAIDPEPWQTDDSIGPWGYVDGAEYMTPDIVVDKIIDIVSKNGNMLLNVPIRADGTLDAETIDILQKVGTWFDVNGEAIYGTRPWHTFGEGDNRIGKRDKKSEMSSSDIRFTTKGDVLYAFVLGWPEQGKTVIVKSLNDRLGEAKKIARIELLGHATSLNWTYGEQGVSIIFPEQKSGDYAHALKIQFVD